jgi:protein phosphatase
MNKHYGYEKAIRIAYSENESNAIFESSQELFNVLPLSTVICNQIIVMHGGLPRFNNVTLDIIKDLPRKNLTIYGPTTYNNTIMNDLLWSDPFPDNELCSDSKELLYLNNPNRGSIYYTKYLTREFLVLNNLSLVVRSHETACDGFVKHHQDHLLTLFSSPHYANHYGNVGAILHITSIMGILSGHVQKFLTKSSLKAISEKSCRNPRVLKS